jgi:hypothetical protein
MRPIVLFILLWSAITIQAQEVDSTNIYINSVEKILNDKPGLGIGGYGEVHYNQPLNKKIEDLGTLDVHRMVLFLGYNFSSKTQFVSEIEFEYAKELWVEQMFLQHKVNKYVNLRAGLLLIPMGIINEYHEPTTFNGVERPMIDNKIAPTTWREIGIGFSGNILQTKTKYQFYVVNGLNGYDANGGLFSGSKTLREGRQKGSKAYISSPNFTGKIEYYGVKNMNIGVSGYFGKSQSRLYNNLHEDSTLLMQKADSSVVNISMIGADIRYNIKGVKLTGQLYYTLLGNTKQYNIFTSKGGKYNDLGSSMMGYYAEIGYNVFQSDKNIKSELMPFLRYEVYNTHQSVENIIVKNDNYHNTIITTGLTYTLIKGAVLKADIQYNKSKADEAYTKVFNAGFGIMF